ncbi:MAG: putative porin [Saprospiraceae bacterium]|jgi:hypothetical protein
MPVLRTSECACWAVLFLLLFLCVAALGQRPGFGGQGGFNPPPGGQQGTQPAQQEQQEPDTFPIFSLFSEDYGRIYPFRDTLLDNWLHQYDAVRRREQDYKNLGIPGSAHQALVYAPRLRRGFDPGIHQYDLYMLPASRLPFYKIQRAFTNVGFNRGSEQTNGGFSLQFSRNFADGLNISIDYQRLSHTASNTLFPNQRGRNTALGIGFWVQGKGGRYQAFFAFADNKFEHDDNGGILEEPVREGAFFTPNTTPVNLRTAGTRQRHQEFLYTQYYALGKVAGDSARGTKRQFLLGHQIGFRGSTYKFFDPDPAEDAAYYGAFQTDSRGVRHFLAHDKLENQLKLIAAGPETRGNDSAPLELGVVHTIHRISQEPQDSSLQELFLRGSIALQPVKNIRLRGEAYLGVLGVAGDYQINASLAGTLGKHLLVYAELINQLYSPTLIQEQLFVTQVPVWQNAFDKTLETNLSGKIFFPSLKLELGAAAHLLNNFIYFDTAAVARQVASPVSAGQLFVRNTFRLWKIFLDNQLVFQAVGQDVLRLPALFGKHSLYFQGTLFRVMESRLGIDLRYASDYFSDQYFPLTGQFHLQDREQILFYPQVDVFFNMKVTKFRAFVKWENLSASLMGGKLLYQVPGHPWPPVSGLRLGFKWRFTE